MTTIKEVSLLNFPSYSKINEEFKKNTKKLSHLYPCVLGEYI